MRLNHPAGLHKRLRIHAEVLLALLGQRLGQLSAQAVRVLFIMLDQQCQILEELLIVDRQLIVLVFHPIVLHAALVAYAEGVVPGKIRRFPD